MDVSVIIPVYNYNITPLVNALHDQLEEFAKHFEILLIDDCSTLSITYINMKVKYLDNVSYKVLSQNIGRSAIRNKLFETAKYDNCICLDCDMLPENNEAFIKNYLNQLEDKTILVGGHYYQEKEPKNEKKRLHWFYGKEIESKPANERNKFPYRSFMSSNFACKKNTFYSLKFNEDIKGYGHEDTLLAFSAKENNIRIKHIENALLHNGLDEAETFLAKQKNAIRNLKILYNMPKYKAFLRDNIKLIQYAEKPLLPFLTKAFEQVFMTNLKSKKPKLIYLQMMKIIWWHKK